MLIQIPNKLVPVFQGPARWRGAYGGRGSAKSVSFARMALARGWERPLKILCGREYQNSIKDSIHAELCKQTDQMGLSNFFDCQEKTIKGRNGTEIIYRGFYNNLQSIKSLTDVDICWIDEAETISQKSWEILIPTIRNHDSEIWATWNPERTDSPTKKLLLDEPPPKSKIVEMNWRDNPWFNEVLDQERRLMQRRDPERYLHVWEGQCTNRSEAQIFKNKWIVDSFEPQQSWNGPYFGADWGFSVDPTTLVKCWINDGNLYIEHEAHGLHTETRDIPQLFDTVPDSRRYVIYADSARPETISAVKRDGFKIEPCEKWKGSVEDGIEHMRGAYDKIIIHPRCVHTIQEFQLYSYKVDRLTQAILPDIIDQHNHCIDAIRYALGKVLKRAPRGFFDI